MRPSITTLTRMGLAAGALTAGTLGIAAAQSGATPLHVTGPEPTSEHQVDLDEQITPVLPKFAVDQPIMVTEATFESIPDMGETEPVPSDDLPILGDTDVWEDGCPACGMG